jgi:hypothetical protein
MTTKSQATGTISRAGYSILLRKRTVESWVLIISIAYPYIHTVSAAMRRMNGYEIGFDRLRQPMSVRHADIVPDISIRTTSGVN